MSAIVDTMLADKTGWSAPQWLAYLEGWSYARLGTPKHDGTEFRLGAFEAAFVERMARK